MYLDLNCFSYESTFSSVSYFIIASLSISTILTHFSENFFRLLVLLIDKHVLKSLLKSISLQIITIVSFTFFFFQLLQSFFVVSSQYSSFILIFLSISISSFSTNFSYLSVTISRLSISFRFFISLGFEIFICSKKKIL